MAGWPPKDRTKIAQTTSKFGTAKWKQIKGFWGKLVLEDVREYSKVYGEVLLGIHKDLKKVERDLSDAMEDIEQRLKPLDSSRHQDLKKFERDLNRMKVRVYAALGISVVAFGGVLWILAFGS